MNTYRLNDRAQFQAQAILQGKHTQVDVHKELMDWISNQFGVHALDFSCEQRESSKGLPQQLVHLILETVEDLKYIYENHEANKMIPERFLKYFKSTDSGNFATDPLKNDIYPLATNPFPEIIVTYRPLKELDRKIRQEIVEEMLRDEQRGILKKFESVWNRSMSVVFYYTDAQIEENLANGTSAKIKFELHQAAIKYGLNESSPYRFDSKESFDRDYESNWYYYWK